MSDLQPFLREPKTVPADATLSRSAQLMEQGHVGALLVSKDDVPYGIVTDRDLALFATLEGNPGDTVASCVSTPLIGIGEDASVQEAVDMMRRNAIRRLAVQDADGNVVGVVAADDFFAATGSLLGQLAAAIQREFRIEEYPTPSDPLLGKE